MTPSTVWLFASQGPPWTPLAQDLFRHEPSFREEIDRCDTRLRPKLSWSLTSELLTHGVESRIDRDPRFIQPAVTSIQLAIGAMLTAKHQKAEAVAGLSLGELAAAVTAGALTRDDALEIAVCQAESTTIPSPEGFMVSVQAAAKEIEQVLRTANLNASIAVELSPSRVVLAGLRRDMSSLMEHMSSARIRVSPLELPAPYHSAHVAALERFFMHRLGAVIRPQQEHVTFYSSVFGGRCAGDRLDATYWWNVVGARARFEEMVRAMLQDGHRTFQEIAPAPMLARSILETAAAFGATVEINSLAASMQK